MFSEAARRPTGRRGAWAWATGGCHEWVSETPLIDVVRTVIGVASVLVGCLEIFSGTPEDCVQPDETEP
jgi:hypothetical protein